jgi:beta-1,2-mannobiose phosphorylase / 1,2-beta-oligomannan phosphorylase
MRKVIVLLILISMVLLTACNTASQTDEEITAEVPAPTATEIPPVPTDSLPPPATEPPPTATKLPPTEVPPTNTPEQPTPTPEPTGDGVHWTKHLANPVLDVGVEGAWDSALVGEPRILKTNDGFQMVYVGQDGTREGGGISPFYGYSLGVANSTDGITWIKNELNPVIGLTGSEFGMLWHGGVLQEEAFFIYYTLGSTRGGRVGQRIFVATSPDGITWTPNSDPVIDLGTSGSYDGFTLLAPIVLVEDGLFKMWYNAISDEGHMTIAYATSSDGLVWEKYAGNPVFDLGPEAGPYYPAILKLEDTYMMWFSFEGISLAISPDGITWTMHPDNPVLSAGEEGEWDGESVLEPSVYFDGRIFHMWFTGSSGPFEEKIGYATSP